MKKQPLPFIVDMRHNSTSDPTFGVSATWEGAIKIAVAFWRTYDGKYDQKTKTWAVGEGYAEELTVEVKEGKSLCLRHADGEGPYIAIYRAKKGTL